MTWVLLLCDRVAMRSQRLRRSGVRLLSQHDYRLDLVKPTLAFEQIYCIPLGHWTWTAKLHLDPRISCSRLMLEPAQRKYWKP